MGSRLTHNRGRGWAEEDQTADNIGLLVPQDLELLVARESGLLRPKNLEMFAVQQHCLLRPWDLAMLAVYEDRLRQAQNLTVSAVSTASLGRRVRSQIWVRILSSGAHLGAVVDPSTALKGEQTIFLRSVILARSSCT